MHDLIIKLLQAGGTTDEEMQWGLEMPANTQRPRRRELQLWGRIIDSGNTRATKSGRQAVVWVLAAKCVGDAA